MMRTAITLMAIIASVVFGSPASAQHNGAEEEMLYICSYNADTDYSNELIGDLVAEYNQLGGKHKIVIEAMNCNTLDSHNKWMSTMNEILERHPNPKIIFLYGPEAWACYLSLTDEKWKKIPLCLLSAQRYGARTEFDDIPSIHRNASNRTQTVDFMTLSKDFNVKMCYYYEYGAKEDINILKEMRPELTTIAVVGDNSYAGYSMLKYVSETASAHYPNLNIIEVDGSREDTESAKQMLDHLPKNSAVIYCIWRYDKDGAISLIKEKTLVSGIAKEAPVMSLTGRGFGSFAVGGYNPEYSWRDGRILPSMLTYQLVDLGIDIEPYYYRCPNTWQFDMALASDLDIDKDILPAESHIINADRSISELYRIYPIRFTMVISIVALLLMAFVITLLYSIRINRMKDELEESEKQLRTDKETLERREQELRTAKEKAEASDKMKTHFIHNISHEIRTPLNAIHGFSQIILDPSMSLDTESRSSINYHISHNVEIVTEIVDDILIYSDLESSDYTLQMSDINCERMCKEIYENANKKQYTDIEMSYTTDLPEGFTFHSDEQLVKLLMSHLLRNAKKFTEQGTIRFMASTKETHGVLTLTVEDTGPGIPTDKADYIFGTFKKLNEFTQGTGLGLSICRLIAKRLGGNIQLDTTYKNGARFVFTLPV